MDTFVEERMVEEKVPERDVLGFETEAVPTPITEIVGEEKRRLQVESLSSIGYWRPGSVFGSVVLVGGDPGIGNPHFSFR